MDRVQYIHDTLIKTKLLNNHHSDVIMSAMSQITGVSIAYSTIFSGADKENPPKLRVTGLCGGKSSVTGEFPSQRVSNAENVSIWWRHHGISELSHHWFNTRLSLVACSDVTLHVFFHMMTSSNYKHFPRHWPFVRGIHRSPVNYGNRNTKEVVQMSDNSQNYVPASWLNGPF